MSKAYVLVVDDEPDIRELVREILEDEGYAVATAESADQARSLLRERTPQLVLLDIWMPGDDGISLLREWAQGGVCPFPVVMISGHGTVETAVEATRHGAMDFVEKPLSMGKLLATVEQALNAPDAVAAPAGAPAAVVEPVGRSSAMRDLREQAERLAGTDSWVLISGEPGSGRKCLGRYIHSLSERRSGPLVEVAAGTIAGQSAAHELFGQVRGDQVIPGRLEAAAGGTLILDGAADLDAEAQTRLASAIDAGSFQRVGGSERLSLDVRMIAISRRDLTAEAHAGRFRPDLAYALSVIPLTVPPLREHAEDIPELVVFQVDRLVEREQLGYRRFTVAAQNRLRNHHWPGNVQELHNLVQRLLVLGDGIDIEVGEVEAALTERPAAVGGDSDWPQALALPLREARERFERDYLQRQLQRADGSVAQLARLAGMERTHLYRKLRALGIDPREGGESGGGRA
ncbi:sigma-54-dependent transcriptional regulator [Spiribacter roseus]|uniref:sigma-54-dependent transcriptional regulator n=1 Tax=Spiribacter roseus TaxID=1855875 RepID=UPI0013310947|nr:sigma-54 dependent transcriptional regulator [Spiribacter roseus]KAF0283904.1 transcriptional regulator [Spiribacter roseus]